MAYKRLGDVLLAAGVITEEDLNKALAAQKGTGKRLGTVLEELGIITESQLIEALEMQLGVDFIDLSKAPIAPEMVKMIPKNIARKHSIVPVKLDRDELYIAMSDPLNFIAVEDARKSSGKRIVPMIATTEAVDRAIITLYGNEGAAKAIEEMKASVKDTLPGSVSSTYIEDDLNAAPTIRLVNSIIERAVTERASDIHLEARENDMLVRLRVDGMLRNVLTVPGELQNSVISRLKVMSNMDTSERKIPQDGRANVRTKGKDIDLRVSTLPTIFGEKMVIRILDKSTQLLSRDGIGIDPDSNDRLNRLMRNNTGVFLIAGPTGSGKSSTMSMMTRELNREEVNIITLEDPVEYNIEGINQVQINEKTNMTFASGLRSILRQDPDIISVGEIRDGETAEIAMRAALTGHLVLSTIHTNDSIATLERLYDIGVEPYLVSSALKGVISQRLVRRICPACKKAYTPDDDELEYLGIKREPGMVFYKGNGCPSCFHTGYHGRTGVFEILLVNPEIRKCITRRAPHDEILSCARKDGFRTMKERCIEMVKNGETTSEEALRTINSAEE